MDQNQVINSKKYTLKSSNNNNLKKLENFINFTQKNKSAHWKSYLNDLINEHFEETQSKIAKKILENFDEELKNFKQICPKEMLDKLSNPLSLKIKISKAV